MMFAQGFQAYVCPGDVISCEAGPFTVLAQIVPDNCPDAPDQRQDGFWPSLYADAPGFIGEADQELVRGTNSPPNGPNHRQRFAEAQARAEAVMEGWRKGDWFFCGIVLSVSLESIQLASHAASLWGIEANYPGADNRYLKEVANELLPESIAVAHEALTRLAAHTQAMEGA